MQAPVPQPDQDRWSPLIAGVVFAAGLVLLVYALTTGAKSDPAGLKGQSLLSGVPLRRQRERCLRGTKPGPPHERTIAPRTQKTRLPKPLQGTSFSAEPESLSPSLVASLTPCGFALCGLGTASGANLS